MQQQQQQHQHLVQMQPMNMMAPYYPNNVTTDHIQQYLDENKSLILKIVESQNLGKLSECAENQARLQRNLMYLAAIADSQPQQPSMHSQYAGSGILHPSPNYMQHQQSQQMASQSLMAARNLYGQQTYPSLQQQTLHGQLGMSSGSSSGLMLQGEPHSSTGLGTGGFPDFIRSSGEGLTSGSKRDIGSISGEGRGGSDGGESLYLKRGDDGN